MLSLCKKKFKSFYFDILHVNGIARITVNQDMQCDIEVLDQESVIKFYKHMENFSEILVPETIYLLIQSLQNA
jgi:hypothetical protein